LRWLWCFFHRRRIVCAQSHHSSNCAVRLGMAKLFAAAVVEEDQRGPLPQIADAGSDVGRTICGGGRTDTCMARDTRVDYSDGYCVDYLRLPDQEDGDSVRQRLKTLKILDFRL